MTAGDLTDGEQPRWRMPAEWAPHERCLIAWPTRDELWGDFAGEARAEYARVIQTVLRFEPVTLIVRPGLAAEARAACGDHDNLEIVELPIDDSWVRDSGPIFVFSDAGERALVDFRFNAWGEKLDAWAEDDALPRRLAERFGIPRIASPMVLEGGSFSVDGEGTLITTAQCLLNPNRNPGLVREEIEAELRRTLGVSAVIWLPYGSAADSMTDGHVDGVCVFARPGVVLLQQEADPASPYHERYLANRRVLETARDARGRALEIVAAPRLAWTEVAGKPVRTPLVNMYLANGAVIVPVAAGADCDEWLAILAETFPEREIAPVPVRYLPWNGGAIHCITQQMPATGAADA